jgi:phage tail tube protein FII
MYARGHFKQAYERVQTEIKALDEKKKNIPEGETCTAEDTTVSYFYKLHYTKAKLERKMRLLTEAESTCDFLISTVKTSETPQFWWKYAIKAAYIKVL